MDSISNLSLGVSHDIKAATRAKDKPTKEKYTLAIANYILDNYSNHTQLTQLFDGLESRLRNLNPQVTIKAHILFHTNILSDISLPIDSRSCVTEFYCNNYLVLPNVSNNWPLSGPQTRLIIAYNRYLNQRLLHFSKLKLDLIREKRYKCISPSSPTFSSSSASYNNNTSLSSLSYSAKSATELLDQAQCALTQTRLILDCLFPQELLRHPVYSLCYNLLAIDISSLFNFLNYALVYALQNFFGLMRPDAERTLFIYKEFTQLQVTDEILNFVDLAPNMSNPHDLVIPQALRQDDEGIINLTRSLESYLYANEMENHYQSHEGDQGQSFDHKKDTALNIDKKTIAVQSLPPTPTSTQSSSTFLSSPTTLNRVESREGVQYQNFKHDQTKDANDWNDIFDSVINLDAPSLALQDCLASPPCSPITPNADASKSGGLYISSSSSICTPAASRTTSYALSISTSTTDSFGGDCESLRASNTSIKSKFRNTKGAFLFKGLRTK